MRTLQALLHHAQRLLHRSACGATDGHLLNRFRDAGDESAFELLVWRHGPMVLSVCRRVLGDEYAAEDAFQATFLTLAKPAQSVGGKRWPPGCIEWPTESPSAQKCMTFVAPGAIASRGARRPHFARSGMVARVGGTPAPLGRRNRPPAGRISKRIYPLPSGRKDERRGGPRTGLPRRHGTVAAVPARARLARPAAEPRPGAGIHSFHLFHSTASGSRGPLSGFGQSRPQEGLAIVPGRRRESAPETKRQPPHPTEPSSRGDGCTTRVRCYLPLRERWPTPA